MTIVVVALAVAVVTKLYYQLLYESRNSEVFNSAILPIPFPPLHPADKSSAIRTLSPLA